MKPPLLNVNLQLTPSEAAVLLHVIDDGLDDDPTVFEKPRLESLRDKLNAALYGETP